MVGSDSLGGFLEAWEGSKNGGRGKKKRPCHAAGRASDHFRRPRPVIPCWVAPLQSPTPFGRAGVSITEYGQDTRVSKS
jgi:hypothetical protein